MSETQERITQSSSAIRLQSEIQDHYAMLFPCSLDSRRGEFTDGGDRTVETIGEGLAGKFVE